MSRSKYFRKKKAGTLPPLPVQAEANVPALPFSIGETSMLYIMTRARGALLFLLCQAVLLRLSEQKSKGYQGASGGIQGGIQGQIIPLLFPRFRKWVRIKSLLYFKRRRKSKRKRKRKRG